MHKNKYVESYFQERAYDQRRKTEIAQKNIDKAWESEGDFTGVDVATRRHQIEQQALFAEEEQVQVMFERVKTDCTYKPSFEEYFSIKYILKLLWPEGTDNHLIASLGRSRLTIFTAISFFVAWYVHPKRRR